MKRFLSAFLFVPLMCMSIAPARADDPINEGLKKNLQQIKDNYPTYISAQYTALLDQYFGLRTMDYNILSTYLFEDASTRRTLLRDIWQRWSELKGNTNTAEGAAEMYVLLSKLKRETQLASARQDEMNQMIDAWTGRCEDKTLNYARWYFNPKLLFPVDNIQIRPDDNGVKFTVMVGYSSQGLSPVSGYVDPESKADEAILAVGVAGGAAIGAAYGSAGGPIGAAIGAVVGSAVVLFKHMFERVGIVTERFELVNKIRDTMSTVVQNKYSVANQEIIAACQSNMDAALGQNYSLLAQIVANVADNAQGRYLQANAEYAALAQELKLRLLELNQNYFTQLVQQYINNGQDFYKRRTQFDDAARTYTTTKIFPVLRDLRGAKKFADRVTQSQKVWDLMIDGETSFATGLEPQNLDAFTFNQGANPNAMRGVWTSTVRALITEIRK